LQILIYSNNEQIECIVIAKIKHVIDNLRGTNYTSVYEVITETYCITNYETITYSASYFYLSGVFNALLVLLPCGTSEYFFNN